MMIMVMVMVMIIGIIIKLSVMPLTLITIILITTNSITVWYENAFQAESTTVYDHYQEPTYIKSLLTFTV